MPCRSFVNMRSTQPIIFVLLSLFPVQMLRASDRDSPPPSPIPAVFEMPGFDELIGEGRMRFELPSGFQEAKPRANPLFPSDKAVRNEEGSLEIRYAIRPLGRIRIDYEDPHSSARDPNHMFPLMFQSLVTMLSNGQRGPTREFPKEQAQERFNADWAAAAVFDVSRNFNSDCK